MNNVCAHPTCKASHKNHSWGKIKAEGWFQQKDGTVYCPKHIPDWVESWRAKREQ